MYKHIHIHMYTFIHITCDFKSVNENPTTEYELCWLMVIKVKKNNDNRYLINRRESSATNADFVHLFRATHAFAILSFLTLSLSLSLFRSLFLSEVRATFKSVSCTHTTVKTSPPLRRKDPFSPTQLRSVHARKFHSQNHTLNILSFVFSAFFSYSHWTPLLLYPLVILRGVLLYNDTRNRL